MVTNVALHEIALQGFGLHWDLNAYSGNAQLT